MHITGATNVAEAARDAGVERLIHVSALGADKNSTSRFLKSKAEGEKAVLNAFPTATIVRPSHVFGYEDRFLNRFASTWCTLQHVALPSHSTIPSKHRGWHARSSVPCIECVCAAVNCLSRPIMACPPNHMLLVCFRLYMCVCVCLLFVFFVFFVALRLPAPSWRTTPL